MKSRLIITLWLILIRLGVSAQAPSLPEVTITDFKIFNRSILAMQGGIKESFIKLKKVTLNYKQNNFTIAFLLKDTTASPTVFYSYRLEGFDTQWTYSENRNSANYMAMPDGKYIFNVRASSDGKKWSNTYSKLLIVIDPPFWKRGWFYVVETFVLGGVLLLFFRYREKRLKNKLQLKEMKNEAAMLKNETEKKLFEAELKLLRSQLNPHFLFNSLSSIQSLINKHETEAANIYLSKFSGLMRMILNNSDQSVTIDEEIKALETYLELEKLRIDFNYKIEIDPNIDIHHIEIPGMILQPLVENAIFHGLAYIQHSRMLCISLTRKGNAILSVIEDNGIGIKQSKILSKKIDDKNHGKGIQLTKDRLEALCKTSGLMCMFKITDKSELPNASQGTMLEVEIPILI
jgi:two-component sensor histidine kinase